MIYYPEKQAVELPEKILVSLTLQTFKDVYYDTLEQRSP